MLRNGWWAVSGTIAIVCCLVLFQAPLAFGQLAVNGTITGRVSDPSGAALPAASVIATDTDTKTQTSTQADDKGIFVFSGLPVGTYTVTISNPGFQTSSTTGIILHPAIVTTVNMTMRVGQVSTRVSVTADAAQVQTSTSEVSSQVSREQASTLPLNGRNYQSLSALMPGVTNTSPGTSLNQGGFLTANVMSINGMGLSGTLYTLDGIWNMNTGSMRKTTITPNPDTIQEIRVLQNNFSVQYSLLGSSVVLLDTKSGTDTFHGTAFEYFRNDALDARNYFSPSVSPLKQNIFGYTLGGPAYIPHHFNSKKDKVFFFWSQQWVRQHIGQVLLGSTPTADMRQGIFNDKIIDPTTNQPFSQNGGGQYVIPQSRISSDALALLDAMAPLPNNPQGGFQNYINLAPTINSQRDDEAKIDYNLTPKLRLMGEYLDERQLNDNSSVVNSPFNSLTQPIISQDQLAQIRLTAFLAPTMVNAVSVAMNNLVVNENVDGPYQRSQVPGFHEVLPYEGGLGSNRIPLVTFTQGWSTFGVPVNLPLVHAADLEDTVSDGLSWLHGPHYVNAGVNVVWGTKRQTSNSASNGHWVFNGVHTGDPIADYVLGDPASLAQNSTQVRAIIHYPFISPYLEDNWKATSKLTLTGGLRVYYMPMFHAQPGYQVVFDPALYNPANAPIVNNNGTITPTPDYDPLNGLIINGVNGAPIGLSTGHSWQYGPQGGFAYDVRGDGKTALRGGYGITYIRAVAGCANACTTNPPKVLSITLTNPTFPDAVGSTVAPAGAPTISSADLDREPAARVQTYSLSLEQQFGSSWTVSVAGVGNIVWNILENWNRNQPLPTPGYDFNPIINGGKVSSNVFVPYLGYAAINTDVTKGKLDWNALEVEARHATGHNLFLSAAYTWQHGLTDQRVGNLTYFESSNVTQDIYHPEKDYGNSNLSPAQILAISYIWQLPWYQHATGWQRAVLGGWQYSGIATFMSGFPLDPGFSTGTSGLAIRPNRVAKKIQGPKTVNEWFNTAAFAAPAAGFFGNSGTGIITGPGVINFDMAFYKTFQFDKWGAVQFRAELFNTFNHTNFSGVSTTLGNANFGHVTSALDPRIAEFALRYQF